MQSLNDKDFEVKGIACNSQMIKSEYIFVCLDGEKDSGYRYVKAAIKNGAKACIANRSINIGIPVFLCHNPRLTMAQFAKKIYDNPDEKLFTVGVTGTNGKTTTTHLIKEIFINAGKNIATVGTNGCFYNYYKTSEKFTTSTTPESCQIYGILADMVRIGADSLAMEVSSHALSLDRVEALDFDVAIFTNLTQDHLDFHNDMESYFQAKRKLFVKAKKCIINTDDEYGKRLYNEFKHKSLSFGFKDADFTSTIIKNDLCGTYFDIYENNAKTRAYINIPGNFSVYNAMASYICAKLYGINSEIILEALKNTEGVTGRFERLKTDTDFNIIIDYAHSPDSLLNVLKSAKNFTKGRVIALFGCGGNRDKEKRSIMGKISGKNADLTVITSDNPRFEEPMSIISDIEKGISSTNGKYKVIPDRREAIKYAILNAKKGDTVLLLGKGHEKYIITGNKKTYFCEKEEAEKILLEMKG